MTDPIDILPAAGPAWTAFEQRLASGDAAAVQRALAIAIEGEPGPAHAYLRISQSAYRAGLVEMAASAARKAAVDAAAMDPVDAPLALSIAEQLLVVGEFELASRSCSDIRSDDPGVLHECARILMRSGVHGPARGLLQRAARQGLDSAAFHKTQATLHSYFGDADRAEANYLEAMARGGDPLLASPMSRLRTWSPGHNHVDALLHARAGCAPDSREFADHSFALFKQLDDLGRHEEAWPFLEAGNRAWRAGISHDAVAHSCLVDRLVAAPTPTQAPMPSDALTPIFILGLPRAGSTLLERLLGQHSRVSAAGELADFAVQARMLCGLRPTAYCDDAFLDRAAGIDPAELGRRYLGHVAWRAGGRRWFIDKQPLNFLHVGLIHAALPQARILHAWRAPMEACFSIFKFLFARGHHYAYDLSELTAWYHDYRRLMRHWHAAMPGRILDVSHEALLADPEGTIGGALEFCGLDNEPLSPDASPGTPVATGSALQVAQPITDLYRDRWRPYARHLGGLEAELARYADCV